MKREFIFTKMCAQLLKFGIDSGEKSLNVVINGIDPVSSAKRFLKRSQQDGRSFMYRRIKEIGG